MNYFTFNFTTVAERQFEAWWEWVPSISLPKGFVKRSLLVVDKGAWWTFSGVVKHVWMAYLGFVFVLVSWPVAWFKLALRALWALRAFALLFGISYGLILYFYSTLTREERDLVDKRIYLMNIQPQELYKMWHENRGYANDLRGVFFPVVLNDAFDRLMAKVQFYGVLSIAAACITSGVFSFWSFSGQYADALASREDYATTIDLGKGEIVMVKDPSDQNTWLKAWKCNGALYINAPAELLEAGPEKFKGETAMQGSPIIRGGKAPNFCLRLETVDGQYLGGAFRVGQYIYTTAHELAPFRKTMESVVFVGPNPERVKLTKDAAPIFAEAGEILVFRPPLWVFAMLGVKSGSFKTLREGEANISWTDAAGVTLTASGTITTEASPVDFLQQFHSISTAPGTSGWPVQSGKPTVGIHCGFMTKSNRNTFVPAKYLIALTRHAEGLTGETPWKNDKMDDSVQDWKEIEDERQRRAEAAARRQERMEETFSRREQTLLEKEELKRRDDALNETRDKARGVDGRYKLLQEAGLVGPPRVALGSSWADDEFAGETIDPLTDASELPLVDTSKVNFQRGPQASGAPPEHSTQASTKPSPNKEGLNSSTTPKLEDELKTLRAEVLKLSNALASRPEPSSQATVHTVELVHKMSGSAGQEGSQQNQQQKKNKKKGAKGNAKAKVQSPASEKQTQATKASDAPSTSAPAE